MNPTQPGSGDPAPAADAAGKKTWPLGLDGFLLFLIALAVGSGLACWWIKGPDVVWMTLRHDLTLLGRLVPVVALGLVIAGSVQVLAKRWPLARWLGEGSGFRGILIAWPAGIITPGGPFTSFPLVLALHKAGAAVAVTVTYITAWSVTGLHRLLVWELPFLGLDFVLTRFLASLPLAVTAGLIAQFIVNRTGRVPGPGRGDS